LPGLIDNIDIAIFAKEVAPGRAGRAHFKLDGLVKSLNNMSFRAKREILPMEHAENTRFLLPVEMTDPPARRRAGSPNMTFYENIKL